jgi:hypothetical protein
MKYSFVLGLFAAASFFVSCANDASKQEPAATQEAPKPVDAPAYQPSSTTYQDSLVVKGECIVFYYPSPSEVTEIENGASDTKKFLEVANSLKPKLEAEGYTVYISSDKSVQMHVSDTRSHLFERSKMVSKFGAVFYNSKNGPFFCEGLRDADNYMQYINRYFKGQN